MINTVSGGLSPSIISRRRRHITRYLICLGFLEKLPMVHYEAFGESGSTCWLRINWCARIINESHIRQRCSDGHQGFCLKIRILNHCHLGLSFYIAVSANCRTFTFNKYKRHAFWLVKQWDRFGVNRRREVLFWLPWLDLGRVVQSVVSIHCYQ